MFKNLLALSKNRNILSVFISLIIFALIFLISSTNFLYIFDKKIQNLYFEFNDTIVNKNIVVVEIDEESLAWRKDNDGNVTLDWLWRFPFDRSYYATVIDNLKEAGAAVIALDVIFWEKSTDESDDKLSESIKKAWNVILWLWPNSSWLVQQPYYKFWNYMLTSWYLAPNVDKSTNIVYSITPIFQFRNSDIIYNHFSIAIIRWFYSKIYDDEKYLTDNVLSLPDKYVIKNKIELLKSRKNQNEVLINYSDSKQFTKKSFLDIYYNKFDKNLFKDKIVVIWATAKWIKDIFTTPIWTEYWVYTHVNMINTILTKNGVKYFDKNIEWFLIFLLIIVSVYFNISKSSYVLILSNIAIVSIFIFLVLYITILTNLLLNYSIELALALVFSLAISNIVKYLIENRHKTKLNKALSEYVSEDIANEILSWEWKISLDWENKNIAIFFSDIEWFTSISEKFSPEDLVWFLREYLSAMSNIIMDNKWFVNKYEWDAIMALWWVFGFDQDSSYQMCLSAIKQQEALKRLNLDWKSRWFSEIKVRIWMHFWKAIIWNIWSEWRKMEFTALWDSVNLASRLEWVNKFYWTYICVSEDIYNIEKNNFEFRYLDKIRVKWKENSINIYELLSLKWELQEEKQKIINKFEEAIEAYKEMRFKEALDIFKELSELWDGPSITYKKRCETYIKKHPNDSWDGVWTMTSK